jgi:hypothetical protein
MVTQSVEPVDESPRRGVSAFISYSRRDAKLADRLVSDLEASGVNAYIDRHDIAPGEAWQDRLGHDFELAGEIFDALLEVAEEYRAPDLPVAMMSAYRGPMASGSCFGKWLGISGRRPQ